MKNSAQSFWASAFAQTAQECRRLARRAFNWLQKTPLPRLAVFLLGIALLISLIPLMLTLFLIFLVIKLMLGLVLMNTRKQFAQQSQTAANTQERTTRSAWQNQDFEDVEVHEVKSIKHH